MFSCIQAAFPVSEFGNGTTGSTSSGEHLPRIIHIYDRVLYQELPLEPPSKHSSDNRSSALCIHLIESFALEGQQGANATRPFAVCQKRPKPPPAHIFMTCLCRSSTLLQLMWDRQILNFPFANFTILSCGEISDFCRKFQQNFFFDFSITS